MDAEKERLQALHDKEQERVMKAWLKSIGTSCAGIAFGAWFEVVRETAREKLRVKEQELQNHRMDALIAVGEPRWLTSRTRATRTP